MSLRRATAEDAPACAVLVRHWLDASDGRPGGPSRAELETAMRDGFPVREARVADDGEILGYPSPDPDNDHIRRLTVARPGGGVGHALVDLAKKGRDRLSLNTHIPNSAAHRFYEREGFVSMERTIPGADGVAEQRMEWRR